MNVVSDVTIPKQQGFTLIELMIVVVILAILAAIVVPSYRIYIKRSAEADVQKKMLSLSNELEQWRAKALTYKGYKPKNDSISTTGKISYPASNARYTITVGEVVNTKFSVLNPTDTEKKKSVRGTDWVMIAEPTSRVADGQYYKLNSAGLKCSNNVKFKITDTGCGSGSKTW